MPSEENLVVNTFSNHNGSITRPLSMRKAFIIHDESQNLLGKIGDILYLGIKMSYQLKTFTSNSSWQDKITDDVFRFSNLFQIYFLFKSLISTKKYSSFIYSSHEFVLLFKSSGPWYYKSDNKKVTLYQTIFIFNFIEQNFHIYNVS